MELSSQINELRKALEIKELDIIGYKEQAEMNRNYLDFELDSEMLYLRGKIVSLEKERDDLIESLERLKDDLKIL